MPRGASAARETRLLWKVTAFGRKNKCLKNDKFSIWPHGGAHCLLWGWPASPIGAPIMHSSPSSSGGSGASWEMESSPEKGGTRCSNYISHEAATPSQSKIGRRLNSRQDIEIVPQENLRQNQFFFLNFFIFLLRFFADPSAFFPSPPPSRQRGAAGHGTHITDLQRALESRPGISAQSPGGGNICWIIY